MVCQAYQGSFTWGSQGKHSWLFSCGSNLDSYCTPTTSISSMLHVTIPKFTGIDTDKKTPSKFPWFDILKWVSNNIHGVYYTTDNSSDLVDIEVSNTEAPEYIWWCPNCVLVVAGTKIYMGGRYLHLPTMTFRQSNLAAGICLIGGSRYWFLIRFHFAHYQGYACRQWPWYQLQTG